MLPAADGTDAIRTYMKHAGNITLVLLDMDLSRISGEAVLAMIIALNPRARVIAVSGAINREILSNAIQMGAQDSLSKPYTSNDLLLKVQNALWSGVQLNS